MSLVEWYPELRLLHIGCAAASFALFTLRGGWMLSGSALLQRRWVKILPHVIDSVLLASAVALTLTIRHYPFESGWLTAKLVALVAYIVLGMIALKRGRTKRIRAAAFLAALATFAYIVGVAIAHDPGSWWRLVAPA